MRLGRIASPDGVAFVSIEGSSDDPAAVVKEFADQIIFMKPNTAIVGPNVPIQLPADADPVHFEGELAVVIGRPCKDVPAAQVAQNILGYTIANDVSARDQQKKDGQWMRAKGHDTFCPVGPWIVTSIDPS